MKKLYIIRHAKSSWASPGQPDVERPLNERGKNDAPMMAKRLLKKQLRIDAFMTSPANRALTTCRLFAKEYAVSENKIMVVDKLYHAPAEIFYDVISGLDNLMNDVAIFAHNPGITDFANSLCHGLYIDNMPTCGILAVESNIESWKDFRTAEKKYLFFDYPKSPGT